ncbi:MAG: hypothetical protein DI577_07040 [Microbacterium sp.]|nr:MAG: hypothetical protein DI577_07040 [Microbacterium sp.]PZU35482.1 MAG: hypothetical protein DI575_07040 [Microbacterium sp.]
MGRGLEILPSPACYGPHTKYFPYVSSVERHSSPLVTADDDSIYPRWWLRRLQNAATRNPDEVVCYRAHRVAIDSDGVIARYNSWGAVRGVEASVLNFATGVSGVHYPAEFLMRLKEDGDRFLMCTPRADDVWLHSRAVAHGFEIRQIVRSPIKFPEIASTQEVALHLGNTGRSANDTQIAATYDEAVRTALRAAAAR